MVRHYVKRTYRSTWSSEAMDQAVDAVISGKMGCQRASTRYSVPSSTLERYVKKKRDNVEGTSRKPGKFKPIFTAEQETIISSHLIELQKQSIPITVTELRRLAYQLAEKNGFKHNFNKKTKLAGEAWAYYFINRHHEVNFVKADGTPATRATALDRTVVSEFFNLLTKNIQENRLNGNRIYACDELSITDNTKHMTRVVPPKVRKANVVTSVRWGDAVGAAICFSAVGTYMPPMLIYPRDQKLEEYEVGLPDGSWVEVQDYAVMTIELFERWLSRFAEFSNARKDNPILLLLSRYASLAKHQRIIDTAQDNGIILQSLPSDCLHRLQPLDVAFMKPLAVNYDREVRKWTRENPGRSITLCEISPLFGEAFLNSATMRTALDGFKKTGIWPVNPDVFEYSDSVTSPTVSVKLEPNPSIELEPACSIKLEPVPIKLEPNMDDPAVWMDCDNVGFQQSTSNVAEFHQTAERNDYTDPFTEFLNYSSPQPLTISE